MPDIIKPPDDSRVVYQDYLACALSAQSKRQKSYVTVFTIAKLVLSASL